MADNDRTDQPTSDEPGIAEIPDDALTDVAGGVIIIGGPDDGQLEVG